jgi:hypothetical protein
MIGNDAGLLDEINRRIGKSNRVDRTVDDLRAARGLGKTINFPISPAGLYQIGRKASASRGVNAGVNKGIRADHHHIGNSAIWLRQVIRNGGIHSNAAR